MIKKILLSLLLLLAIVILGIVGFVYSMYDKNYNEEYPVTDLKIISDSSMIERGRYLVNGPAHCSHCHSSLELFLENNDQNELALSGGFGLQIPPGMFYGPNITPDMETGIGKYSDGELYRMLRYNIRRDGMPSIDFMSFINLADEDIYSIIAYIKSQNAVNNKMPETELSFLGKFLYAMGLVKPGIPDMPLLKNISPDTTAEYGKYLAYSVANCRGCHTVQDQKTGEYIGEDYAGGRVFGPDVLTENWVFTSPNLTTDEQTGVISDWDEDDFIENLKGGREHKTSPMPWETYQKMSENDLKAIYRFLRTLKPVNNLIDPVAIKPEETDQN